MTATKLASYAAGLDTPELQSLRTKHAELLDIVDNLRGNNLGKYVELPQIVVVGDQSSGKSSVLSAISRVQFPSRGNVCTRFATELALRVANEPRLEATIRAREGEAEDVKEHLDRFKMVQTKFDKLSELIEAASSHMNIAEGGNYFSRHTLCIKIFGPSVPQLTLVDLPGFYDVGRENQPIEYAPVVKALAKEYMKNKNSIILAVVAASYTTAKQETLEIIKKYSDRALGVITKPDLMPNGGDSRTEFLGLLDNQGATFMRYGWHVLRNLGEGETMDFDQRDEQEEEFFLQKLWQSVSADDKGIVQLRKKLCDVLLMHIAGTLPVVAKRIDKLAEEYTASLAELPEARDGIDRCQRYLLRLTEHFTQRTSQSTGASDMTFDIVGAAQGDLTHEEMFKSRNLRSKVRDMNEQFIMTMATCGSRHLVQWTDPEDDTPWIQPLAEQGQAQIVQTYGVSPSTPVTQEMFERYIDHRASLIRANELPGDTELRLVMPVFFDQSQPWGGIANRHADLVLDVTRSVVEETLTSITENDESTRDNIMNMFIEPFFKDRHEVLHAKIQELLPLQHRSRYPVALEMLYKHKVQERQYQRRSRLESKRSRATTPETPPSTAASQAVNNIASARKPGRMVEVLDKMIVYYNLTVETFVTNVIMLVIENELMVKIPGIFTMDKILQELGTEGQQELVKESNQLRKRREILTEHLKILNKGKHLCDHWIKDNKNLIPITPFTGPHGPHRQSNGTNHTETNGTGSALKEVEEEL